MERRLLRQTNFYFLYSQWRRLAGSLTQRPKRGHYYPRESDQTALFHMSRDGYGGPRDVTPQRNLTHDSAANNSNVICKIKKIPPQCRFTEQLRKLYLIYNLIKQKSFVSSNKKLYILYNDSNQIIARSDLYLDDSSKKIANEYLTASWQMQPNYSQWAMFRGHIRRSQQIRVTDVDLWANVKITH